MHPIVQRRGSRGMTLIEVLISIVIFAIGLLGIAALQVAGLRYTKGSQTRATAALMAENLADRMRANITAVNDGEYEAPQNPATDCAVNECDPNDMADYDWSRWLSDTRQALGVRRDDGALNTDTSVNATVCIDSQPQDGTNGAWACDGTGNIHAIKIEWCERAVETGSGGGDTYSSGEAGTCADGFVSNRFVMRFAP